MISNLEYYKVLGINVGAGIADVTSSYKRLCRIYHPDINDDPEAAELMKRINIAYSVLRDKLRREAAFRERQSYSWPDRRGAAYPDKRPYSEAARRSDTEETKQAYTALHGYFTAINTGDYAGAYGFLTGYDRRQISRESYIEWRKSVARLYPMREFKISGGQLGLTVTLGDGKSHSARKFNVVVTEEDIAEEKMQSGGIEKMVVCEGSVWRVFLGYKGVVELTRGFDERFEAKRKRDIAKRWDEYSSGLYPEYNMLSINGMRKAASREIYRQKRFGGTLAFAVLSVKAAGAEENGRNELLLSTARSITGALRETDIPAYAGDGVFAILFVELQKKNAREVLERLCVKIRQNAGPQLGQKADIETELGLWRGRYPADMDALNAVLKKFRKKM